VTVFNEVSWGCFETINSALHCAMGNLLVFQALRSRG
jgi:hypothetical protein